jgi:Flp pilus assembly protein TadD
LGILLLRVGRSAEARVTLEQAVALIPDDAIAHLHLGRLLLGTREDLELARFHLARTLSLAPEGRVGDEARSLLEALDGGRSQRNAP